jgi:hypothetical protein
MYQNKILASFSTSSVPAAKSVSDILISNESKGSRFFANQKSNIRNHLFLIFSEKKDKL